MAILLTAPEAREKLEQLQGRPIHIRSVYRAAKKNRLPFFKDPLTKRLVIWDKDLVEAYVKRGK